MKQRSRRSPIGHVRLAVLVVVLVSQAVTRSAADVPAADPSRPSLEIPEHLRLLVVAPHPDDETLGAAGLMQRVKELHGRVTVAYLTSGDGYVDGVELETHTPKPRPGDFVDYGERRLREALRALHAMSVRPRSLRIFGFPDGGLADLLTTNWSSSNPYVSPYTHDRSPPYPESMDLGAVYSGVALERDLARVITKVNPSWIAVTAPWDIHSDHCAAFHFVVRALHRLTSSNPRFSSVRVLAYTVHRPDWPSGGEGQILDPPPGVGIDGAGWRFLELTSNELSGKGNALDEYASQMDIMAVLFRAFVRPNEVFAVYPSAPPEPAAACGRPLTAPPESAKR